MSIWRAAEAGDLAEVERLVGHDPGLLNATDGDGRTPVMWTPREGHVGVVRWLLDKGAAIDQRDVYGQTALWLACRSGHHPVVRLLLEGGGDPTIALNGGGNPLITASEQGHLKVVSVLLGHPSAKATINDRNDTGKTALWWACCYGRGGVATALLENGADPTIAENDGTTPVAVAMQECLHLRTDEGRRECVAALEVRCSHQRSFTSVC
jgi:ankyrin repeat protein